MMSEYGAERRSDIIHDVILFAHASTTATAEPILPESRIMDDLGLDSLAVMDFVMTLEDRFDVSIPMDRLAEVRTIADLAAVIGELKRSG